ncbi:serine hydroxymethyltransferase [bacterium]|nr:serine hydroxymethyltransferase [bacterium]
MDQKILDILSRETDRQNNTIELIASENYASEAVMELSGSIFTNKYAEGYPGKRYYNGCDHMDEIESMAIEEVTKLFGCNFANVQPHCGANANTAVYQAFLEPGDKILGMDLASGGHLSHGSPPNISGKIYQAYHYGVNEEGLLDYDAIMDQAKEVRPQMIVAGASAYPRQIDWAKFRIIADEVNALLLVDMAHYSGLIAGKCYDSPIQYADVVTSTTHKTLRGPRGGIILWNKEEYSRRINSGIFPGTQGGPLMNMIAAKAQCFVEANSSAFGMYANDVLVNARAFAEQLTANGFECLTGGTDSHIILLDLTNRGMSGKSAANLLEMNGITVNKNGIPDDPRSFTETSGIRLGTAAETTKGHDTQWFRNLADEIADII